MREASAAAEQNVRRLFDGETPVLWPRSILFVFCYVVSWHVWVLSSPETRVAHLSAKIIQPMQSVKLEQKSPQTVPHRHPVGFPVSTQLPDAKLYCKPRQLPT